MIAESMGGIESIPSGPRGSGRLFLTSERLILIPSRLMRWNIWRLFLDFVTQPYALELDDFVEQKVHSAPLGGDRLSIRLPGPRWVLLLFVDHDLGSPSSRRVSEWVELIEKTRAARERLDEEASP